MPIRKTPLIAGECYHVYSRAVAKKTIFHNTHDYSRFILKAREYKHQFPVDILAYCIMPNHFHFLLRPHSDTHSDPGRPAGRPGSSIGTAEIFLHRLLTSYSRYYTEHHEEHSGYVFQGRYSAKHVANDAYLATLIAYIHDNPVRKKLANSPLDWPWSSYLDLVGRRADQLTTHDDTLTDQSHEEIYAAFAHGRDAQYKKIHTLV